jgi:hypothetical protein
VQVAVDHIVDGRRVEPAFLQRLVRGLGHARRKVLVDTLERRRRQLIKVAAYAQIEDDGAARRRMAQEEGQRWYDHLSLATGDDEFKRKMNLARLQYGDVPEALVRGRWR